MLETCLSISGRFEGGDGGPRYDLVTGNFDEMGISVGCLQWNPGTGSIQTLLKLIFQKLGGCPEGYEAIQALAAMKSRDAVTYVVQNWIDTTTPKGLKGPATPEARELWEPFLALPESVEAQQELAQAKLDKALDEAEQFLPFLPEIDLRTAAFFFDLRVQQGGLIKRKADGTLWRPALIEAYEQGDGHPAVSYARSLGKIKTSQAWMDVIAMDPLANVLLDYAFQRAQQARSEYVWDTLSRRGTIACRVGSVHGSWVDLRQILP